VDRVIVLSDRDNVATSLADLAAGEAARWAGGEVVLCDPIAFGHKFALTDIAAGDEILKYGEVIGLASQAIAAGAHVHVHNVESVRARGDKLGDKDGDKGADKDGGGS